MSTTISRLLRLPATPTWHPGHMNIYQSLDRLKQRLRVERQHEILAALDRRMREDFGLAFAGVSSEAPERPRGLPREVFSWTRFGK